MLYKEGDKVLVRADLEDKCYYMSDKADYWWACGDMFAQAGKVVTITAATKCYYNIAEDEGVSYWSDEMFSGLAADLVPVSVPVNRVNDYSKACWYCRKGGTVNQLAFYFGRLLLCPVCGRAADGRESPRKGVLK